MEVKWIWIGKINKMILIKQWENYNKWKLNKKDKGQINNNKQSKDRGRDRDREGRGRDSNREGRGRENNKGNREWWRRKGNRPTGWCYKSRQDNRNKD